MEILFTVSATGLAVMLAWLRLRSGSVWPSTVFHAAHNALIQSIFDKMTGATAPPPRVARAGPGHTDWLGSCGRERTVKRRPIALSKS